MIDGIRRRFGRVTANDSWDAAKDLKAELDEEAEHATGTAISAVPAYPMGSYEPDDASTHDYFRSLVQTAIENGGRHGDHSMSVPWLRMILAGLESKQIELSTMWHGIETGGAEGEATGEIWPYEGLFHSDRDAPELPR